MKLFYILCAVTTISFVAAAQQGIHKGDMYKSDSLQIEIVYPVKKSSLFQIYFYNSLNQPAENVKKGSIHFFFSKDNADFIGANLVQRDGVWTVSLEDWKEFHHALLQFELPEKKHQLEFWNRKYQLSLPTKQNSGDGHSGHSH